MKIYLDSASTTFVHPEVLQCVYDILSNHWANPSSVSTDGLKVRQMIETARTTIADILHAKPNEIIFTSGACEANSVALCGFLKANKDYHLITTRLEHKSIIDLSNDIKATIIENDCFGRVNLDDLERICKKTIHTGKKPLVSICMANNEIGTIQPIKSIEKMVHKYRGVVHTDATQYLPTAPIKLDELAVDMLSFSGQKLHAPKGIGCLFVREGILLKPLIYGSQESSLRGGTENAAFDVALSKALQLTNYNYIEKIKAKRDRILNGIFQIGNDLDLDIFLNGHPEQRLNNNINVTIPGINSDILLTLLDIQQVTVSAGSACCSGENKPSHVLKAIGLSDEHTRQTIRITLDSNTKDQEIERFLKILYDILLQHNALFIH